ncbi:MAG TPA: matrixin family metalloprotease, partial [Bryobacteraceae bacterium]|nr:matrixin family metalloprotease [Bryobacteraceae bacterium]
DAGENWHVGAHTDLFSVALHEAGHALGLGHSDRPGTVMYPYYHILSGLTADDIDGIQHLYGSAGPTQPSSGPPPVSPEPATPPAPEPQTPATQPPAAGDHTAPSLRIVWPASTIVSAYSGTIEIRGVAADDAGVQRVEWKSSAGDSGVAAGTSQWSAVVPLLVGDNVIIVRAYDAAGNSSWRALTVVRR